MGLFMKRALFIAVLCGTLISLLAGCGGGGGSSSDSGSLYIQISDAKPLIPGDPQEVWITFSEVLVHKAGGDWISLPLPHTPYSIDLLQFQNGATTELVPPVDLEPGQYTQIRFGIERAFMVMNGSEEQLDLDVPSGILRTDKSFEFPVESGRSVDLIVDFDLSRSIVATGGPKPTYKLKPVLHINYTQDAATIEGSVAEDVFGESDSLNITVYHDDNGDGEGEAGEAYTTISVVKPASGPAEFSIFWLVPADGYIVVIWDDKNGDGQLDAGEQVYEENGIDLGPGDVYRIEVLAVS